MTVATQDTASVQGDRAPIVAAIVAALSEVLHQELTDVTEETRLAEDLSLDSTSVLSLLMALEDALDMQVDPDTLEQRHLVSVGSLAGYVIESR